MSKLKMPNSSTSTSSNSCTEDVLTVRESQTKTQLEKKHQSDVNMETSSCAADKLSPAIISSDEGDDVDADTSDDEAIYRRRFVTLNVRSATPLRLKSPSDDESFSDEDYRKVKFMLPIERKRKFEEPGAKLEYKRFKL